jgi:hypothetical protein
VVVLVVLAAVVEVTSSSSPPVHAPATSVAAMAPPTSRTDRVRRDRVGSARTRVTIEE